MSRRDAAMASMQNLLPALTHALATALVHEGGRSDDPQLPAAWEHVADLLDNAADLARRLADSAGDKS